MRSDEEVDDIRPLSQGDLQSPAIEVVATAGRNIGEIEGDFEASSVEVTPEIPSGYVLEEPSQGKDVRHGPLPECEEILGDEVELIRLRQTILPHILVRIRYFFIYTE